MIEWYFYIRPNRDSVDIGYFVVEAKSFINGLRKAREAAIAKWDVTHEELWVISGGQK